MCSSYSAFDCISWNRLIAQLIAVCFFLFSNKRDILNFRVMAVRDIDLRTCLRKNIYVSRDFLPIQKLKYYKNCLSRRAVASMRQDEATASS